MGSLIPGRDQVNTAFQYRVPQCSLTYDGPATTITWRRNGVVITLNATPQKTKNLVDPVVGAYQAVLTINLSLNLSNIAGTYNCTVKNARGESSETLVIPGES